MICDFHLQDAIRFITINSGKALGLFSKGSIEINKDADIIIMDDDYYIDTVISNGNTIIKEKKLIKRSYYSE